MVDFKLLISSHGDPGCSLAHDFISQLGSSLKYLARMLLARTKGEDKSHGRGEIKTLVSLSVQNLSKLAKMSVSEST